MGLREIREGTPRRSSMISRGPEMRRVLEEAGLGACIGALEKNGVCTLDDLKKVKYSNLSTFGIVDFEPRRRIFELIKKLHSEEGEARGGRGSFGTSAIINTPLAQTKVSSAAFPYNINVSFSPKDRATFREKLRMEEGGGVTQAAEREQSVLQNLFMRPRRTRRELMDDIIEEAGNSLIEEEAAASDSRLGASILRARRAGRADSELEHEESINASRSWDEARGDERIKVVVRKRPLGRSGGKDVVEIDGDAVVLNEHKQKVDLTPYLERHRFRFDMAFDSAQKTEAVYGACVQELVEHAMRGGTATCLAYGQTGSGKTYTMLNEKNGVMILSLSSLLQSAVKVSFYEIYSNNIYDLLDNRKRIYAREKDGKVVIMGIVERSVSTVGEAMAHIRAGLASRMTGRTGANSTSSRSHAIFRVRVGAGLLTFVDLAGSERGSERATDGAGLKREGAEINKSLLALKECIRAMDRSAMHLPFRQSKLTQVLKESLIGNSMCCIIATVSPEQMSAEHTLNTLRYAFRIKEMSRRGRQGGWLANDSQSLLRDRAAGSSANEPADDSLIEGFRKKQRPGHPDKTQVLAALDTVSRMVAGEESAAVLEMILEKLADIISAARAPGDDYL